jgi:hypothetical protein
MSKSTLAKLLATENLRVEYRNVQTASFNLKERIVTLPVWNDTTPEIEDLLIGHEVGHAIDTPIEYIEASQEMPSGFRGFLNVVEDARIERLIKDRYPGIRKSFSKGYAQFMDRDFFELKDKDINKMLLIDRINVYFKVGPMFPVEFTPEEKVFVNQIDACTTFDEVKEIATDLFEYCKKELEDKKEEDMQNFEKRVASGEFDEFDDADDSSDDFGNSDDDDGNEFDDGDEFDDGPSTPEYEPSEELKDYDELKSVTDENLERAIKGLSEDKEIKIGKLPDESQYKFSDLIVSYKKIVGNVYNVANGDQYYFDHFVETYNNKAYLEFEVKNKNAVSYLVKEFEMKKRAAELRRVIVSDTGMIDTNKLHTYKFNDDIFRKVGNVAAGKNHGIMFFVDWSGSMSDNIKGTIEQLITLTTFCRKVKIPFEVYAFATEWTKTDGSNGSNQKAGSICLDQYFNLLNLFSSRMSNSDYRRMANDLLNYSNIKDSYNLYVHFMNPGLRLGGTPLNQTIMASMKMVKQYQKANRLEVIDVVFLTDGEDSSSEMVAKTLPNPEQGQYGGERFYIDKATRYSVSYVEDPETGKKYRLTEKGITDTLLRMLKDKTGCNLLGFFIVPKNRKNFEYNAVRLGEVLTDASYKSFKNEKFYEVTTYGYDKYFLIPGGGDLNVDDESLEDIVGEGEVTGRRLKTAFLKMNRNRLTNRVLLSKTIDCLV